MFYPQRHCHNHHHHPTDIPNLSQKAYPKYYHIHSIVALELEKIQNFNEHKIFFNKLDIKHWQGQNTYQDGLELISIKSSSMSLEPKLYSHPYISWHFS